MRPISKAALYIGIIIAIVGGVTFWLGGKTKKFRVETIVQAPPSEVFKHITDPELIPKWADGVVEIEPLSSERNQEGSRARVTYKKDGKTIVFTDEVKAIETDSRLLVASTGPMFKLSSDYSLVESGMQTKLRVEVHINYRGIYRFLGPFLGNQTAEKQLEADIQKLRMNAEASFDPANYQPPPRDDDPSGETRADDPKQDAKKTEADQKDPSSK